MVGWQLKAYAQPPRRPFPSLCWMRYPGWKSKESHAFCKAWKSPFNSLRANQAGPRSFMAWGVRCGNSVFSLASERRFSKLKSASSRLVKTCGGGGPAAIDSAAGVTVKFTRS
eukprot:16452374-Heterocapsa_arctica.AAC.3